MFDAVCGREGSRASVCCVYDADKRPPTQERPYNHDSTASRLLSEVKHGLAGLVLRWGTTLEYPVLFFSFFPLVPSILLFYASNTAQLTPCSVPYRHFGLFSLHKSHLPRLCTSFSLMSNLRNYSQSSISGMDMYGEGVRTFSRMWVRLIAKSRLLGIGLLANGPLLRDVC